MVTLDKSKILVTGSAGYIASHLQSFLAFVGLDPKAQRPEERKSLTEFSAQDPAYKDVECIVHLADRRLFEINRENIQDNIEQHKTFLNQAADLAGLKKIIFASSCSVYGFSEEWVQESSTVNPTSFYAESKLAVEEHLKLLGLPHLTLRFGTAYGWSMNMREDLFINELTQAAAQRRPIEVYAAEAWRPYIHCRDFAKTLAKAVTSSWQGPLNVVTGNYTKSQLLELDVLKKTSLQYSLSTRGDPRNYRVQINKDLVEAPVLLEEGIHEMLGRYHA